MVKKQKKVRKKGISEPLNSTVEEQFVPDVQAEMSRGLVEDGLGSITEDGMGGITEDVEVKGGAQGAVNSVDVVEIAGNSPAFEMNEDHTTGNIVIGYKLDESNLMQRFAGKEAGDITITDTIMNIQPAIDACPPIVGGELVINISSWAGLPNPMYELTFDFTHITTYKISVYFPDVEFAGIMNFLSPTGSFIVVNNFKSAGTVNFGQMGSTYSSGKWGVGKINLRGCTFRTNRLNIYGYDCVSQTGDYTAMGESTSAHPWLECSTGGRIIFTENISKLPPANYRIYENDGGFVSFEADYNPTDLSAIDLSSTLISNGKQIRPIVQTSTGGIVNSVTIESPDGTIGIATVGTSASDPKYQLTLAEHTATIAPVAVQITDLAENMQARINALQDIIDGKLTLYITGTGGNEGTSYEYNMSNILCDNITVDFGYNAGAGTTWTGEFAFVNLSCHSMTIQNCKCGKLRFGAVGALRVERPLVYLYQITLTRGIEACGVVIGSSGGTYTACTSEFLKLSAYAGVDFQEPASSLPVRTATVIAGLASRVVFESDWAPNSKTSIDKGCVLMSNGVQLLPTVPNTGTGLQSLTLYGAGTTTISNNTGTATDPVYTITSTGGGSGGGDVSSVSINGGTPITPNTTTGNVDLPNIMTMGGDYTYNGNSADVQTWIDALPQKIGKLTMTISATADFSMDFGNRIMTSASLSQITVSGNVNIKIERLLNSKGSTSSRGHLKFIPYGNGRVTFSGAGLTAAVRSYNAPVTAMYGCKISVETQSADQYPDLTAEEDAVIEVYNSYYIIPLPTTPAVCFRTKSGGKIYSEYDTDIPITPDYYTDDGTGTLIIDGTQIYPGVAGGGGSGSVNTVSVNGGTHIAPDGSGNVNLNNIMTFGPANMSIKGIQTDIQSMIDNQVPFSFKTLDIELASSEEGTGFTLDLDFGGRTGYVTLHTERGYLDVINDLIIRNLDGVFTIGGETSLRSLTVNGENTICEVMYNVLIVGQPTYALIEASDGSRIRLMNSQTLPAEWNYTGAYAFTCYRASTMTLPAVPAIPASGQQHVFDIDSGSTITVDTAVPNLVLADQDIEEGVLIIDNNLIMPQTAGGGGNVTKGGTVTTPVPVTPETAQSWLDSNLADINVGDVNMAVAWTNTPDAEIDFSKYLISGTITIDLANQTTAQYMNSLIVTGGREQTIHIRSMGTVQLIHRLILKGESNFIIDQIKFQNQEGDNSPIITVQDGAQASFGPATNLSDMLATTIDTFNVIRGSTVTSDIRLFPSGTIKVFADSSSSMYFREGDDAKLYFAGSEGYIIAGSNLLNPATGGGGGDNKFIGDVSYTVTSPQEIQDKLDELDGLNVGNVHFDYAPAHTIVNGITFTNKCCAVRSITIANSGVSDVFVTPIGTAGTPTMWYFENCRIRHFNADYAVAYSITLTQCEFEATTTIGEDNIYAGGDGILKLLGCNVTSNFPSLNNFIIRADNGARVEFVETPMTRGTEQIFLHKGSSFNFYGINSETDPAFNENIAIEADKGSRVTINRVLLYPRFPITNSQDYSFNVTSFDQINTYLDSLPYYCTGNVHFTCAITGTSINERYGLWNPQPLLQNINLDFEAVREQGRIELGGAPVAWNIEGNGNGTLGGIIINEYQRGTEINVNNLKFLPQNDRNIDVRGTNRMKINYCNFSATQNVKIELQDGARLDMIDTDLANNADIYLSNGSDLRFGATTNSTAVWNQSITPTADQTSMIMVNDLILPPKHFLDPRTNAGGMRLWDSTASENAYIIPVAKFLVSDYTFWGALKLEIELRSYLSSESQYSKIEVQVSGRTYAWGTCWTKDFNGMGSSLKPYILLRDASDNSGRYVCVGVRNLSSQVGTQDNFNVTVDSYAIQAGFLGIPLNDAGNGLQWRGNSWVKETNANDFELGEIIL